MSVADVVSAVAREAFRDAMAQVAAAVHVVTTDGPGGRAGFTASAVCSLSDAPPMLLVCLNRQASVHAAFERNGVLCVNTLAGGHEGLALLFGGKTPMHERFASTRWSTGITGAPQLADAAVCMDCRVLKVSSESTHDVLFCEVMELSAAGGASALIYQARRFRALEPR